MRAYAGDDLKVYRQIMAWTLQFDDVLDADVIKSSISQLLEIGAWRKLGGRLRLSVCPRLLVPLFMEYLLIQENAERWEA